MLKPPRPCTKCGQRVKRNGLCAVHLRQYDQRRKQSAEQRGYGRAHRELRAQLEPLVNAGEAVCWRCRQPIDPGTAWDLGHDDNDRSIYRGPEHWDCNRGRRPRRP